MHRYIALIWNAEDCESGALAQRTEAAMTGASPSWRSVYRSHGVLVIQHIGSATHLYTLSNTQGIVLGSMFARASQASDRCAPVELGPKETQRIVDTKGRYLVDNYWGSYIAVIRDNGRACCSLLRDPTGNLACFHAKCNRIDVFFADMEDFTRYFSTRLSINWEYIAAHILCGRELSRECALHEIEDIPGGECITLSREGERRTPLWHPSRFCIDDPLENEQEAMSELRSAVFGVVRALAAEHSSILVRLSGGLDSSIVTSCLADFENGPRITCLNFYLESDEAQKAAPAPGLNRENLAKYRRLVDRADERRFARSVAGRHGFRLIEREKRPELYDLRRVWTAPLAPRPSDYGLLIDEDEAESNCAAENEATACFTGEAGDTVFFCTLRAIGALDYAYAHPLGPQLLSHIGATSTLSRESIARVCFKVIKYGLLGLPLPSPFDPMKRPHLLREEVAAAVRMDYFHHPWLDLAPKLCPGKRVHVNGVAHSVPYYHRVFRRERIAPSVHPLASQPVVETCLRIPTYILLAEGISRGLARRTFRDLLPPEVVARTMKGAALSFWPRLVRLNSKFLRESLLGGLLVSKGLLDRLKLEQFLVEDQSFLSIQPLQILDYLDCEAWLRQWNST